MGEVYTCTNNALSITKNTIGIPGKKGFQGPTGPSGNPWAVGTTNPNLLTSYSGEPVVTQVPLIGTIFVPTPFPKPGNSIITGDKFLNKVTGEWYIYDSTLDDGFKWVLQSTNLKGNPGPPNYVTTDISFTKKDPAPQAGLFSSGWSVDVPYDRQLIGHLIWPGSSISGNFTTAQVSFTTKTGAQAVDIRFDLVNLGISAGPTIDDIVVASKLVSSSGNGSYNSMRIVDLNILTDNIPTTPEVFGLFVHLSNTEIQERVILEQIKTSYNDDIALNYKKAIDKTKVGDRNSFYTALSKDGITSINETVEDRNKRIQEERELQIESDLKTKADADKFSEDNTTLSGSKPYTSFSRTTSSTGGGRGGIAGGEPPTTPGIPYDPLNPNNSFTSEVIVHHLSLR